VTPEAALAAYVERGGRIDSVAERSAVVALATHAPALLPLVLADPSLLPDVLRTPLARARDAVALRRAVLAETSGLEDGPALLRALRRRRHREMVRIALREVMRLADVQETSREVSALAAALIDAALAACTRTTFARHGTPRRRDGSVVPFVVLGMGKLGGNELNFGSDIDLVFFHETDDARVWPPGTDDGERAGPASRGGSARTVDALETHEVYARVATATARALGDVTEDGFCFRVDLRLRPEGSRGALTNSLAAAERYYESWGRTWERAALVRARPVAGDLAFGNRLLDALSGFVWRREVRPQLAREMIELVRRARRELARAPERDVKLGPGGIREAEFFVQTLQLVWGGRHRELRVPGTLDALERLLAAGFVTAREASDMAEAWSLLRRVEHRIHMRAGYPTHEIPESGTEECELMARSLGFADGRALRARLDDVRRRVAELFEGLDADASGAARGAVVRTDLDALADLVAGDADPESVASAATTALGLHDGEAGAAHLRRLARRPTSPLGARTREQIPELGPTLLRNVRETPDPDGALSRLADFFARVGDASGYARLLLDEPRLQRRLLGLFGTSAMLSGALIGHPEDVDRILAFGGVPTTDEVVVRHAELQSSGDDVEQVVGGMRSLKRELTLRVGLAYAGGELGLDAVENALSDIADAQVRCALTTAQRERRATDLPLVALGLGKLGARELGFGGDLDLVFVFGDSGAADPERADRATRVAQRAMRMLSQPDAAGPGYATDTRLRPSGSQGMLVVSASAFARYQEHTAAPWERQALLRARAVAGDPALGATVEAICRDAAYHRGAPPASEVARLRSRLEAELAGEKTGRYHPKLGHGALIDIEFAVQFLQMKHGANPALHVRRTREALRALGLAGILDNEEADALVEAHTFFRTVEQALRLVDDTYEPILVAGSRRAEQVARHLGWRERDGESPVGVLLRTYARTAVDVRQRFERIVAPVGLPSPFPGGA
jgi:glutamate-ammonia-ligase adenylyltransferase